MTAALLDARPAAGGARAANGGEPTALQRFIASHYDDLRCRLVTYLGCEDLAGDSLHDAWLRLASCGAREVSNPAAYVFRMACNLAIDGMRQGWREIGQEGDEQGAYADEAPGPAQVAEARSELLSCLRAMQGLPSRRQGILLARSVEDLSPREVALRYGISVDRVGGEVKRARQALTAPAWRREARQSARLA